MRPLIWLSNLVFTITLFCGVDIAPVLAAFPDRPIKVIVPFSPGGGTDLVARTIGITMVEELHQQVIGENDFDLILF